MEPKYQVFVSSTYEDLKEERKIVSQAILESYCFPAGMELFPASNKKQWDIIKRVIDESDFYLLIIAGKYGSIGTDDRGNSVSYTEMEFNYALDTNKPIIALIHGDPDAIPKNKSETSHKRNRLLSKFRERACNGRVIKKWTTPEELRTNTILALVEMKKDTKATGWIKAKHPFEVLNYKIFEQQRTSFEERINELNFQKDQFKLQIQENNHKIKQSTELLEEKQKEIDKLHLLLRQYSGSDLQSMWIHLAQINFRYSAFGIDPTNIIEDLQAEIELDCDDCFFLHHYTDSTLWKEATQKARKMLSGFFEMSTNQQLNYLSSITFLDDAKKRDVYILNSNDLIPLFSAMFFLVFLSWITVPPELTTTLAQKRNTAITECNFIKSEIWEMELALCENDY